MNFWDILDRKYFCTDGRYLPFCCLWKLQMSSVIINVLELDAVLCLSVWHFVRGPAAEREGSLLALPSAPRLASCSSAF